MSNFEASVQLEIDLIDMIHFDTFLGENFIKCFFRYYSKLAQYLKEIFLDVYRKEQTRVISQTTRLEE